MSGFGGRHFQHNHFLNATASSDQFSLRESRAGWIFYYRQCVADRTPESAGPLRYEIGSDTMKLLSEELPYPRISATYVCCLPGTLQYTSILLQYIENICSSILLKETQEINENTWNIPATFMPYTLRGTLQHTRPEPR